MLVANFELTVRSVTGSHRRVPYQLLRSDDYTYGRIADYRTGVLRVDGRAYGVQVRNQSRGYPFYAPNTGTVFLIDLNADGTFDETASLTVGGRPMAAELVLISFWATDCAYSERVRSAANDLVAKYGSHYVWVAVAKDTSRADINAYLTKSPMRGTSGARSKCPRLRVRAGIMPNIALRQIRRSRAAGLLPEVAGRIVWEGPAAECAAVAASGGGG